MNYRKYLHTDRWKQIKEQVLEESARKTGNLWGQCELCGYKPYKPCLQLHHKTYARIGNEKREDLILICPHCHKKMHECKKES